MGLVHIDEFHILCTHLSWLIEKTLQEMRIGTVLQCMEWGNQGLILCSIGSLPGSFIFAYCLFKQLCVCHSVQTKAEGAMHPHQKLRYVHGYPKHPVPNIDLSGFLFSLLHLISFHYSLYNNDWCLVNVKGFTSPCFPPFYPLFLWIIAPLCPDSVWARKAPKSLNLI